MRRSPALAAAVAVAAAAGLAAVGCSDDDAASVGIDPSRWTEHWDCGYSFVAGDPEGRQRLVIRPSRSQDAPAAGTVELPSPDWTVQVEVGEHFGARGFDEDHACTDAIDGSRPEARVDEVWVVVDGSLTLGPPSDITEWPGTARVTAERLEVEGPDGEVVAIGEVSVRSDCWGCFPG